jgi:transcriptional regulator with XRE-family HTH domain
MITSDQLRGARALLRWDQKKLAALAQVSVETIKRLERAVGAISAHPLTVEALRKALETAGIVFIEQNGGGPGVRLRNRQPTSKKD